MFRLKRKLEADKKTKVQAMKIGVMKKAKGRTTKKMKIKTHKH